MIDKIFFSRKKTMIIFGLLAIGAATLLYFGSERESRDVVINEVCADNFCAYRNSSGDYPDYVELYNMSEEDVSGLYLSDSRKNPKKFWKAHAKSLPELLTVLLTVTFLTGASLRQS